jgi:hypothetical protein
MSEVARFFDGVLYGEGDQAEVQARMVKDGVIYNIANQLLVSSGGAGLASVATGEAFVQGFWYKNTAPKLLAITANASATARVDYVILRLDRVANTLEAVIKEGVVGGGGPVLIQIAGGTWEMPLAQISTASSVSTFTDMRVIPRLLYAPATSADILDGTIQGGDISTAAALSIASFVTSGGGNMGNDLTVTRTQGGNPTHGVVYFGSNAGTRYIYYNGTNFQMSGSLEVVGNLGVSGAVSLPNSSITTPMIAANAITNANFSSADFGSSSAAGPWYVINGAIGYATLLGCQGGPILLMFTGTVSGTNTDYAMYVGISNNSVATPVYGQAISAYTTHQRAFCLFYLLTGFTGNGLWYGLGGSQLGNVVFATCRVLAIEFRK